MNKAIHRTFRRSLSPAMSTPRTVTALKRWSCQDKQLPPIDRIKHIHIYDFDNTRTYINHTAISL